MADIKAPKPGDHIGAIDCGSNAIRFSIYRLDGSLKPVPVLAKRFPVRLGAGTFNNGRLASADIDSAIEAFREARSLAESHQVVAFPAVATSAIRDAANSDELVTRAAAEAGVTLRPISGEEEAELIAAGANASVDVPGNRAIFDVGGGSTEIIRSRADGLLLKHASLPLGAVRFAQRVGMPDLYDDEDLNQMRDEIGQILVKHFPPGDDQNDYGIGVGGTARAIAHFAASRGFLADEKNLTLEAVLESYKVLVETPANDLIAEGGIDRSRVLIIVPGCLILLGVMAFLGLESAQITDAGVREGLVYQYLKKHGQPG